MISLRGKDFGIYHYQDGDFIVQRGYGRESWCHIRFTGQDTEFRWVTENVYYIKSGDIFTDFPVRLVIGHHTLDDLAPGTWRTVENNSSGA